MKLTLSLVVVALVLMTILIFVLFEVLTHKLYELEDKMCMLMDLCEHNTDMHRSNVNIWKRHLRSHIWLIGGKDDEIGDVHVDQSSRQ